MNEYDRKHHRSRQWGFLLDKFVLEDPFGIFSFCLHFRSISNFSTTDLNKTWLIMILDKNCCVIYSIHLQKTWMQSVRQKYWWLWLYALKNDFKIVKTTHMVPILWRNSKTYFKIGLSEFRYESLCLKLYHQEVRRLSSETFSSYVYSIRI